MTDTELDAIAAELNAVLSNPRQDGPVEQIMRRLGTPPDTPRARQIRQAGLEAVRKALEV